MDLQYAMTPTDFVHLIPGGDYPNAGEPSLPFIGGTIRWSVWEWPRMLADYRVPVRNISDFVSSSRLCWVYCCGTFPKQPYVVRKKIFHIFCKHTGCQFNVLRILMNRDIIFENTVGVNLMLHV